MSTTTHCPDMLRDAAKVFDDAMTRAEAAHARLLLARARAARAAQEIERQRRQRRRSMAVAKSMLAVIGQGKPAQRSAT